MCVCVYMCSQDINDELNLHTELLDDLDRGTEETTINIRDGTRRADDLIKRDTSCKGTCIMVLLLAVIVTYGCLITIAITISHRSSHMSVCLSRLIVIPA